MFNFLEGLTPENLDEIKEKLAAEKNTTTNENTTTNKNVINNIAEQTKDNPIFTAIMIMLTGVDVIRSDNDIKQKINPLSSEADILGEFVMVAALAMMKNFGEKFEKIMEKINLVSAYLHDNFEQGTDVELLLENLKNIKEEMKKL